MKHFIEAATLLRTAGRSSVPIPEAEASILARWVLAQSSMPVPDGILTVAPIFPNERIQFEQNSQGWVLTGQARRVPFARQAARLVVIGHMSDATMVIACVAADLCKIVAGENLAGEARDDVVFDGVQIASTDVRPAGNGFDEEALWLRGALVRSVLMAGALERILDLSVLYAKERKQFGRPIGRFQAIQQQLALLADEVAAATVAADVAIAATERGHAAIEIMAAKIRIGEAAGVATALAHQIHGAIGFTEKHPLHHSTRRLWSWRDEFGTESEWAARLGRTIVARGPDALWSTLTS